MFLWILLEPKTNQLFFFPCYVQYPSDYSHDIVFSFRIHQERLTCFWTLNLPRSFHVTREVTLSAKKTIPSKNKLRVITMGIGPIWGITSLRFILSCHHLFPHETTYEVELQKFRTDNIIPIQIWVQFLTCYNKFPFLRAWIRSVCCFQDRVLMSSCCISSKFSIVVIMYYIYE